MRCEEGSKFWDRNNFILGCWIERYIWNQVIGNPNILINQPIHSAMCRFLTVVSRECIGTCLDCHSNITLIYNFSLSSFRVTFRKKSHKDDQAAEEYGQKCPQNFLLCCGGWVGVLSTLLRSFNNRESIFRQHLFLRNNEEETIFHLFFNCSYTRKLLLDMTESLGQAIWKTQNRLFPRQDEDIRLGDIAETIQKFTKQASCWGKNWALLASLAQHICKEQEA